MVQKENMTGYVYLRNALQNEIREIASELNLLMVKNISYNPGAILHQDSSFLSFPNFSLKPFICPFQDAERGVLNFSSGKDFKMQLQ